MIYGINSHMEHCKKSPFTCFDWQLSKLFFKKPLSEIYKVRLLQPSYFLNARRSAKEYLSDILSNQLSYREYKFVSNRVIEEKKYKVMDSRDKIEFSYHITRFLVMNFLKLYYKNNKNYELNEMLNIYFNLFPANEKTHKIFIKNLIKAKEKRNYTNSELFVKNTELFLKDFEQQFNEYFYNNSREIVFFRHAQTKINEENEFIGQKTNPDIIIPNREITATLKKLIENYGLFFSSPMQRCKNTLNLLTNKNIVIDNRLNEIDYGIVDGKDLSYLSANYPVIIEEWEYGNDPKFPEGESTKDVFNRAMNFINSIKTLKENKIAVCTHNVFLRCLIGAYFKIPLKDWHRINIPFLKPINFILTKDNRFYIELDDNLIEEIFKNI